ncbi:MAG TPA: GTP-binding protein, partial [Candidatus Sumerlaeota bacterium]|nr:GTP-binding protein [Candidatus Sumerlaeota bacterium]
MSLKPLGRLSPRIENPEVLMMLCTAGHVDHGKTSLVTLLTGCQTDRLKEEQERGLTIELGFAPCFLGGNHCVGIVDVPGHEKFVKNMVAGVSGIAMTLLVIAADDGIMPQTIEHFQIMDLLGVRHGMIALTKTDLVEPDVVEQRIQEIRGFFAGTFLDGVPICPVSSHTFEGYPEFYQTLLDEIGRAAHRPRPGVFRMPVEKVFTQEGFGSVVTGIP